MPTAPALDTGPPTIARRSDAVAFVSKARDDRRARAAAVSLILSIAVGLSFAVSVSIGDFPIPLAEVVPAIFGFGSPDAHFIVQTLRLPRALTGLLVGGAFGLSRRRSTSTSRRKRSKRPSRWSDCPSWTRQTCWCGPPRTPRTAPGWRPSPSTCRWRR